MKFSEIQKFRQKWVLALIVIVGVLTIGVSVYGIIRQIIFGLPSYLKFFFHPITDTELIFTSAFLLLFNVALWVLFHYMALITTIDSSGIKYRFFPFHGKFHNITWDTIEKHEIITYDAVKDYGGWGFAKSKINGKALMVSGNKGLKIYFKSGEILLIGTNKDIELTDFLRQMK